MTKFDNCCKRSLRSAVDYAELFSHNASVLFIITRTLFHPFNKFGAESAAECNHILPHVSKAVTGEVNRSADLKF